MTTWQQYELVCTIGRGKYGTVFRARHKKLGFLVALKSVLDMQTELAAVPTGTPSSSIDSCSGSSSSCTKSSSNCSSVPSSSDGGSGSLSKERRSLYHEARVLATLSHPNLVSLVEICVDNRGELVLALEDLGGMSLSRLVRQRKQQERPDCGDGLCDCLVGCVANHVACGLRYLHSRGYLHRDVKPDNIMVESTTRHCFPHAKLIDLGLSIAYSEQDPPNTSSSRAGTVAYMAPELMLPDTLYGPKVDLFSLGACLYFALLGEEPFTAFTTKNGIRSTTSIFGLQLQHEDDLATIRPEVKDVLLASLRTRPDDRCSVQQLLHTPWIQMCAVAGNFVRHARTALPELASRLQLQHDIPYTMLRCLRPNCVPTCPRHSSNSSSLSNSGTDSLEEVSSIRDSCESSVGELSSSDDVFVQEEDCSSRLPANSHEKVYADAASSPLPPHMPSVDSNVGSEHVAYDPLTQTDSNIGDSFSNGSNNCSKSITKSSESTSSDACVSSSSSESVCRVLGLKDAACRRLSLTSSCSCPDGSSAVPREADTVEAVARLLRQDTDTVLRSLEVQPWGQTAGVYNLLSMEKRYIKFSPAATEPFDCCAGDDAATKVDCCADASKKIMNKTL